MRQKYNSVRMLCAKTFMSPSYVCVCVCLCVCCVPSRQVWRAEVAVVGACCCGNAPEVQHHGAAGLSYFSVMTLQHWTVLFSHSVHLIFYWQIKVRHSRTGVSLLSNGVHTVNMDL